VIEDAVELVEAVHRGQVFVAVAEMIFADLGSSAIVGSESCKPCLAAGMPTFNSPVPNGVWPVMNAARPAVHDCWP
jgi:hypothetical protein